MVEYREDTSVLLKSYYPNRYLANEDVTFLPSPSSSTRPPESSSMDDTIDSSTPSATVSQDTTSNDSLQSVRRYHSRVRRQLEIHNLICNLEVIYT